MTDREFKELEEFVEDLLHKERTPEECLASLQSAGILDENGNFTDPYQHLGEVLGTR